jgi:hypothetical protein
LIRINGRQRDGTEHAVDVPDGLSVMEGHAVAV